MEDEKMLPLGEPTLRFNPPPTTSEMRIEEKLEELKEEIHEKTPAPLPGVPSPKQQQWGVVISIVIIVLMIIIGAFYAWGQRIAQNQAPAATTQQY